VDPGDAAGVPSADGVTGAMAVKHDTSSAASLEADVKQPADLYVLISEMSTSYSRLGPVIDARQ
jgi:hypothetical protein